MKGNHNPHYLAEPSRGGRRGDLPAQRTDEPLVSYLTTCLSLRKPAWTRKGRTLSRGPVPGIPSAHTLAVTAGSPRWTFGIPQKDLEVREEQKPCKNLLSANLFHLRRHKAFWAAACSWWSTPGGGRGPVPPGDSVVGDRLFAFLSFFGVVLAAFLYPCTWAPNTTTDCIRQQGGGRVPPGTDLWGLPSGLPFRRGDPLGGLCGGLLPGGASLLGVSWAARPVPGTSLLGCLLITAVWVSSTPAW